MPRKSRLYNAVVLLILLSVVGGCQKTTDPIPDDSAYFPLQTGDYWIYQVTQETYSLTSAATTRVFQFQKKIGSSFTRNGQLFFQVEESTRTSEKSDWQISAIRTIYKNPSEVVSQDNNVPVVDLIFPVSTTTSWNINTYNARADTLQLRYQAIGASFATSKLTFDRTISVVGPNYSSLIGLDNYQRVYAANVGLVYRENTSLAYCQSTADCIGKAIITSGTREKWELTASNHLP